VQVEIVHFFWENDYRLQKKIEVKVKVKVEVYPVE
jgi:hypothetical protein